MDVFTAQQMRDFDKQATEKYHIPSIVLMENAALRVVEFLEAKFAPLLDKNVVVLCGKGNNGGDGLAIARHLEAAGCTVAIYLACKKSELKGDAATQLATFQYISDRPTDFLRLEEIDEVNFSGPQFQPHFVIDALLGTGFKGEITDRKMQKALIYRNEGHGPVVAVDIVSGLNADTGETSGYAREVDFTVTFVAPKRGQFVQKGLSLSREIWVGNIGTPSEQTVETDTRVHILDHQSVPFHFLKRRPDAHKGDAGRVLMVGGSFGMSGAIALASKAALNCGAGLCIAAIPEKILPTFAASILEATSHPLTCDDGGKLIEDAADEVAKLWEGVQVVALGPGISRGEETQKFVQRVVRECPTPLVIDADALHALPAIADQVKNREADTILTPHPGEMGTLMGISAQEVNSSRYAVAIDCAKKYGAYIVLKGARSLVATPDGRVSVNLSGNAGMATGGSGDVLTGTIAGLMAQLKNAEEATKAGVYLHGFAGDLAFETKGNGLVAGDIAEHLGAALLEIPKKQSETINGRLHRLI